MCVSWARTGSTRGWGRGPGRSRYAREMESAISAPGGGAREREPAGAELGTRGAAVAAAASRSLKPGDSRMRAVPHRSQTEPHGELTISSVAKHRFRSSVGEPTNAIARSRPIRSHACRRWRGIREWVEKVRRFSSAAGVCPLTRRTSGIGRPPVRPGPTIAIVASRRTPGCQRRYGAGSSHSECN